VSNFLYVNDFGINLKPDQDFNEITQSYFLIKEVSDNFFG
jgi:hypothetical protein